jgi:hypothetical protein
MPPPGNVEAGVSVLYGDGRIVNPQGSAFFWGALDVGDTEGALFGPGLINPLGAEIHYVLRTHGPAKQDVLAEQLTTFMGGCDSEPPNAPCQDLQFAVFKQVP